MAEIVVEGDTVALNNVILEDAEVARAFGKVPEAEREGFLRNVVLMGILARNATTDEFKVEELATEIRRIVSGTETSVDKVKVALEAKVEELLKVAQASIQGMVMSAEQKEAQRKELEEAKSRTAEEGRKFEQHVGDDLAEIASHFGVEIEHVGESYGKQGKKGDYVIKFEEGDVVFEIKKDKVPAKRYSKKEIMDELVPAVRNRDAGYGIFITKSIEGLPREILVLGVVGDGPYMACGLEEGGLPLPKILPIVCQMARARMAIQNAQATEVGVARIEASCKEALDALNGARRKCKSIRETATAVETDAIDRIESLLKAILGSL
ncbi:MAG: hypothetical protein OXU37_06415 [Thaumarchaeota archaeon]|nr:hypothetical protein [Nitrososphaerota archaeon]RNJ71928.1 MAG: hypothetical protein EB832_04890 [Thaumarchaeota archaeon S14]